MGFTSHSYGCDVLGSRDFTGHHGGGGGHHHGGGFGRARRGLGWYLDDDDDDDGVTIVQNFISTDGVEVLGDDYFDLAAIQRQMNTLKQVPVSVALSLLKGGQAVINKALFDGVQLPGKTSRENVYGKLQWHQNTLAPLVATPNEMYASGDDLKKWVVQSYIEANAVTEGKQQLAAAWNAMWAEIEKNLAALPRAVAEKVNQAADTAKWVAVGVGVVALLGGALFVHTYAGALGSSHGRATGGK